MSNGYLPQRTIDAIQACGFTADELAQVRFDNLRAMVGPEAITAARQMGDSIQRLSDNMGDKTLTAMDVQILEARQFADGGVREGVLVYSPDPEWQRPYNPEITISAEELANIQEKLKGASQMLMSQISSWFGLPPIYQRDHYWIDLRQQMIDKGFFVEAGKQTNVTT